MKQFVSLSEGMNYHTACPVCNCSLSINDASLLSIQFIQELNSIHYIITMSLDTRGEDSLILNTKDESFKVLTLRDVTNNKYHGKFMHGLSMECMSCCQFSYNIQLHMDIIKRKIVGIFLNSENISIEDHGMIHEIKNIYATDETFYACFPKDGTDKRIILPLIPLDLKYPQNTINRIKSLLIFS